MEDCLRAAASACTCDCPQVSGQALPGQGCWSSTLRKATENGSCGSHAVCSAAVRSAGRSGCGGKTSCGPSARGCPWGARSSAPPKPLPLLQRVPSTWLWRVSHEPAGLETRARGTISVSLGWSAGPLVQLPLGDGGADGRGLMAELPPSSKPTSLGLHHGGAFHLKTRGATLRSDSDFHSPEFDSGCAQQRLLDRRPSAGLFSHLSISSVH